jgi:twitching motility protein PilT
MLQHVVHRYVTLPRAGETVIDILTAAAAKHASDIHISAYAPVTFRVDGQLVSEGALLTPELTVELAKGVMTPEQWNAYVDKGELDFAYRIDGISRFRINIYRQRNFTSLAVRVIPNEVPTITELQLPNTLLALSAYSHGLVLVTGPTGSGKSSTLAALIDHINKSSRRHIITLEDPIEYHHQHNLSIINQREIGVDSNNFLTALRAALRQDPDVILVGEMRDLETMGTAMTAAETGHLVLATMHTRDAVQTVNRVIDVFPASQQAQIRVQLASVLRGIVAQRLLPARDGRGRMPAVEILLNVPAVSNLIRSNKVYQIRSILQTGRSQGMQTMEMHVQELIAQGKLDIDALPQQGLDTDGWDMGPVLSH